MWARTTGLAMTLGSSSCLGLAGADDIAAAFKEK